MTISKIDIIIERLERIEDKQDAQGEKIYEMHGKVSKLETRASIFGVIGGLIAAVLAKAGMGH